MSSWSRRLVQLAATTTAATPWLVGLCDLLALRALGPGAQAAAGVASLIVVSLALPGVVAARSMRSPGPTGANSRLDAALLLSLLIGLPLGVLVGSGAEWVPWTLGSDPLLDADLSTYLQLRTVALGVLWASSALRGWLEAQGQALVSLGGSAAVIGANVVLNPVLIWGSTRTPALGLRGAAVAAVTAEVIGFTFLLAALVVSADLRRAHGPFRLRRPGGVPLRTLLHRAAGGLDPILLAGLALVVLALALAPFGARQVATSAVLLHVLLLAPVLATRQRRRRTALAVGLSLAGFMVAAPSVLLSLFTTDRLLLSVGAKDTRLAAVALAIATVGLARPVSGPAQAAAAALVVIAAVVGSAAGLPWLGWVGLSAALLGLIVTSQRGGPRQAP